MKFTKTFFSKLNYLNRFTFFLMLVFLLSAFNYYGNENFLADNVKLLWSSGKEFKTPESVLYDQERDVIYVSNINGRPSEEDNNGFISQLNMDGSVKNLKWIEGLNAPKGMSVYKNYLFVSDINRVAKIDINKGEILKFYEAPKAKFLNDITIDNDGIVYVSDMSASCIYRIKGNKLEKWIESGELKSPNGLFVIDSLLFVGTQNIIFSINTDSKSMDIFAKNTGGIDGLEYDGMGNFIKSDWRGRVDLIMPGESPKKLLDTSSENINAADIFFIVDKGILLVPTFSDNRVMAYEIVF
jgi:sugar lactone lactonase YvrE